MGLADGKYMRFTTFKRDGTPVGAPVWTVALDDDKVGFCTSSTSGKAKRLANNSQVLVQPSDGRGRPKAGTAPVEATAVLVSGAERDAVYEKIAAKYGVMLPVTRFLAKVAGFVKRTPQPYADRGVIVTLH